MDSDTACARLARTAVSQAEAGADGVAPSATMDGQVMTIRRALAEAGREDTLLMSYSTKFASSMYGPFREAEQSAPRKGDRKGYQASCCDLAQALRESERDEAEGADILTVKPALFYLDVLARLRQASRLPVAAYNVSGEYSMLIAAADRGMGDLKGMVRESLFAVRRAGADLIISYSASQYEELLPLEPVYQAGTLSGNPVAVAAGLATLLLLVEDDPSPALERLGAMLADGVTRQAPALSSPLHCVCLGGMLTIFFGRAPVRNMTDATGCDTRAYAAFFHAMLDRRYYIPPSQFEACFISAAHTVEDICGLTAWGREP